MRTAVRSVGPVAVLGVLALAVAACGSAPEIPEGMGMSDITELIVVDDRVGSGNEAVAGRQVVVHYTGWLYDEGRADHRGTEFDSSRGGDPFDFRLGAREVIPGWDQGVAGMQVGGIRTLTIPPALGYGAAGAGAVIPPGATLVFEVELLDVR